MPRNWIGSALFILVGLLLLAGHYSFDRGLGTTPEEGLTVVTGPIYNGTLLEVRRWRGNVERYLSFTVRGYRTEYSNHHPGFDRILAAARAEEIVTVGVSTKRETLLPRKGWVPLYTLSIGPEQIVTYENTMVEKDEASDAFAVAGSVLLLIGCLSIYSGYRNRNAPPQTFARYFRSPPTSSGTSPPEKYDY